MDERQAKEPLYNLQWMYNGILEVYLDMEAHISNATQITQKEPKETTKERGISLTLMGLRSIYNSTHKPQRSLNETIGFNPGDHLHRMCNETGIPEFLGLQFLGIPMVVMVTSRARSLFYPRAHPTHIYVSHVIQILKNPPEHTMRNRVQSGRNTKNDTHAHLLRIA